MTNSYVAEGSVLAGMIDFVILYRMSYGYTSLDERVPSMLQASPWNVVEYSNVLCVRTEELGRRQIVRSYTSYTHGRLYSTRQVY